MSVFPPSLKSHVSLNSFFHEELWVKRFGSNALEQLRNNEDNELSKAELGKTSGSDDE